MSASIHGITRSNGKIYLEFVVKDINPNESVRTSARLDSGAEVPCSLYPASEDRWIACLPVLDVTQVISLSAESSTGRSRILLETHVTPARAKWESRLRSRMAPAFTREVRDFDVRNWPQDPHVEFVRAIPGGSECTLRIDVVLPGGTALEDSVPICMALNGRPVTVDPVFCGQTRRMPYGEQGPFFEVFHYSLRLPLPPSSYVFSVAPQGPHGSVFTELEAHVLGNLLSRFSNLTRNAQIDPRYPEWFESHRANDDLLRQQRAAWKSLGRTPLFSIVVPLYRTPLEFFDELVSSVRAQTYARWELLLVNASPDDSGLTDAVVSALAADERIRSISTSHNGGISENTNLGIRETRGDFICLLDHDDLIEPNALYEYATAIARHPDADLLYCDEDKLAEDNRRYDAFFKPDFNLDLLRSSNYICHMLCIRREVLGDVGMLNPDFDGAQDYDLTLRACERARRVVHVEGVLYHWRVSGSSTAASADAKPYTTDAGARALQAHLDRVSPGAKAVVSRRPNTFFVDYPVPADRPLVSVVIPNKDSVPVLERCLSSIRERTTYENYEVVVVENNSEDPATFDFYDRACSSDPRVRVVRFDGPFNYSAVCNLGAREARGDYLLMLNNDTEVITPEWMEVMLGICAREEVGAVGVRLLYPDETIQHAGVSIAPEATRCLFRGLDRSDWGYFALADTVQNLSAVTAACLMVRRSVYEEISGFDEGFAVAFNDIDLCLRIRETGRLVVYTPEAELFHYEYLSRGDEDTVEKQIRFEQEVHLLRHRWARYYITGDPYHNRLLASTGESSWYYALSQD